MYQEQFGFSGEPFKLTPDARFFFGSKSHNKAMAYLHYGLRQGDGFIVITGEIGAGKSMLITHLMDQIDQTNVVAADLITPNLPPNELVAHILSAFRIEPAGDGPTAEIEAFEDFLFDQMNRGRRVLLIVDEAQNLPKETLEELRVLSNLDYDGTPLFQVFLIAQPDFRPIIASDGMEQLRQRVIASYHLEPLSEEDVKAYVEHRLSVVGWAGEPRIEDGAYKLVYQATEGVPRRINKLFNRVLLYCSIEGLSVVTEDAAQAVIDDIADEDLTAPRPAASASSSSAESAAAPAPVVMNGGDTDEPSPQDELAPVFAANDEAQADTPDVTRAETAEAESADAAADEARGTAPNGVEDGVDPFSFGDLDAPKDEPAQQEDAGEDATADAGDSDSATAAPEPVGEIAEEVESADAADAQVVEAVPAAAAPTRSADLGDLADADGDEPAAASGDAASQDADPNDADPNGADATPDATAAAKTKKEDDKDDGADLSASPLGRALAGAAAAIGLGAASARRSGDQPSAPKNDDEEEVPAIEPSAAPKAQETAPESAMTSPQSSAAAAAAAPMSVLDRVRAKKAKEQGSKSSVRGATLNDVADAIKAERSRSDPTQPDEAAAEAPAETPGDETPGDATPGETMAETFAPATPQADFDMDDDDDYELFESKQPAGASEVLDGEEKTLVAGAGDQGDDADEQARRWRQALAKTVSATKVDLQTAHDHISRLRRKLTSAEQTRRKTEEKISERLDRAEGLLTEIRDAWR